MPRKVCKSARLVEGSMLLTAWIPKNGISVHLILHLSALKRKPVSQARFTTAFRFASWSVRS